MLQQLCRGRVMKKKKIITKVTFLIIIFLVFTHVLSDDLLQIEKDIQETLEDSPIKVLSSNYNPLMSSSLSFEGKIQGSYPKKKVFTYAVWHTNDINVNDLNIYFGSSIDKGKSWKVKPVAASSNLEAVASKHSLALYNDDLYVVWYGNETGQFHIYISKSSDSGETWKKYRVSQGKNASILQKNPRICITNKGRINIVWEQSRDLKNHIYYALGRTNNLNSWNIKKISQKGFHQDTNPTLACYSHKAKIYILYESFFHADQDIILAHIDKGKLVYENITKNTVNDYSPDAGIDIKGEIYVAYTKKNAVAGNRVFVAKSKDKGKSWQHFEASEPDSTNPSLSVYKFKAFYLTYEHSTPSSKEIILERWRYHWNYRARETSAPYIASKSNIKLSKYDFFDPVAKITGSRNFHLGWQGLSRFGTGILYLYSFEDDLEEEINETEFNGTATPIPNVTLGPTPSIDPRITIGATPTLIPEVTRSFIDSGSVTPPLQPSITRGPDGEIMVVTPFVGERPTLAPGATYPPGTTFPPGITYPPETTLPPILDENGNPLPAGATVPPNTLDRNGQQFDPGATVPPANIPPGATYPPGTTFSPDATVPPLPNIPIRARPTANIGATPGTNNVGEAIALLSSPGLDSIQLTQNEQQYCIRQCDVLNDCLLLCERLLKLEKAFQSTEIKLKLAASILIGEIPSSAEIHGQIRAVKLMLERGAAPDEMEPLVNELSTIYNKLRNIANVNIIEKKIESISPKDYFKSITDALIIPGENPTDLEQYFNNLEDAVDISLDSSDFSAEVNNMKISGTLINLNLQNKLNRKVEKFCLVQIIPKEVVETTNKIDFLDDAIILKEDPVVMWSIDKIESSSEKKLSFLLKDNKNKENIFNSKITMIKTKKVPCNRINLKPEKSEISVAENINILIMLFGGVSSIMVVGALLVSVILRKQKTVKSVPSSESIVKSTQDNSQSWAQILATQSKQSQQQNWNYYQYNNQQNAQTQSNYQQDTNTQSKVTNTHSNEQPTQNMQNEQNSYNEDYQNNYYAQQENQNRTQDPNVQQNSENENKGQ